jgi:hypothetical protein
MKMSEGNISDITGELFKSNCVLQFCWRKDRIQNTTIICPFEDNSQFVWGHQKLWLTSTQWYNLLVRLGQYYVDNYIYFGINIFVNDDWSLHLIMSMKISYLKRSIACFSLLVTRREKHAIYLFLNWVVIIFVASGGNKENHSNRH